FPLTKFGTDSPFDSPLETIVLDGTYVTASTQQWNFTIERELVRNTRLRVGYVGSKSTHLKGEYDQNAPIYNSSLTLAQNRATIEPVQFLYRPWSHHFRPKASVRRILRMGHPRRQTRLGCA